MQEWIHKHKRGLSIGLGIVLILIALGMVFWDNTGTPVVSEEEAYAQKVEAMEARMSGGTVSPSKKAEEAGRAPALCPHRYHHRRNRIFDLWADIETKGVIIPLPCGLER